VRKALVAIVALSSMLMVVRPAEAVTDLLHPSSVKLLRGTSSQTEQEAVTAMQSDTDGLTYDVTTALRRGTWGASYQVAITGVRPPTALNFQWEGSPTADCTMRVALYDWPDAKWVGTNFHISGGVTTQTSFLPGHPGRFVHHGKLLGRVSCSTPAGSFTFSTDRIRLDAARR